MFGPCHYFIGGVGSTLIAFAGLHTIGPICNSAHRWRPRTMQVGLECLPSVHHTVLACTCSVGTPMVDVSLLRARVAVLIINVVFSCDLSGAVSWFPGNHEGSHHCNGHGWHHPGGCPGLEGMFVCRCVQLIMAATRVFIYAHFPSR